MRSFSHLRLIVVMAFAIGVGLCGTGAFAAIQTLPDPITGPGTPTGNVLVEGNFYSYSLGFLLNRTGNSAYNIQSSPGQIADDVVLATGAGGTQVNTNPTGMDPAYQMPSGTGGSPFSTTATGQLYQNTPPINPGVWTSSVSAMNTFLAGHQLAFYFNLNQENAGANPTNIGPPTAGSPNGTPASAQDLLGWARVTLTGAGQTPVSYYLTSPTASSFFLPGVPLPGGVVSNTLDNGPVADPSNPNFSPPPNPLTGGLGDPRWTYAPGQVTVDKTTGDLLHFGPPTATDTNYAVVNQNLGANQAAFAFYSPDLNAKLQSGLYTTITVDFSLSGQDNGYEQLFILPTDVGGPAVIPEPTAFVIWSLLGLVSIGATVYRRRRAAA
jgi:hypothetical protein